MKGLTLTYSKDMQEDKEPVFDAVENSQLCLRAMSGMIADMKVNKDNMRQMAGADFSCATDIADWLVKNLKMPFRDAHHATGSIVKLAETKAVELHELKLSDMQKIEKKITNKIFDVLTPETSSASRNSFGGTAESQVKNQIKIADKFLSNLAKK
jgi:argininosuccinate lyase